MSQVALPAFSYGGMSAVDVAAFRAQAARIRKSSQSAMTSILQAGADLIDAKSRLPHGQFGLWVETECGLAPRTAEQYMSAARWAEGKTATVAHLSPKLVYQLAAKSAAPEVVAEVLECASKGQAIDHCEVEAKLRKARKPKAKPATVAVTEPKPSKPVADDDERVNCVLVHRGILDLVDVFGRVEPETVAADVMETEVDLVLGDVRKVNDRLTRFAAVLADKAKKPETSFNRVSARVPNLTGKDRMTALAQGIASSMGMPDLPAGLDRRPKKATETKTATAESPKLLKWKRTQTPYDADNHCRRPDA
jgi:hypothetical protein